MIGLMIISTWKMLSLNKSNSEDKVTFHPNCFNLVTVTVPGYVFLFLVNDSVHSRELVMQINHDSLCVHI